VISRLPLGGSGPGRKIRMAALSGGSAESGSECDREMQGNTTSEKCHMSRTALGNFICLG